jgi:flagellar biosynthetic protein FlhB
MIRYDLQFFAKDGPGGEKTEPATAKKLREAREKGQVAKSHDLTGSVLLLACFYLLKTYISSMSEKFIDSFSEYYNRIGDLSSTDSQIGNLDAYFNNIFDKALQDVLMIMLPILAVVFVIAFVLDLIQVKWKPSTKTMKPDFNKFNPINGVKRLFSVKTLIQLLKSILIIAVCSIVTYNKLKDEVGFLFNVYEIPLNVVIAKMGELILDLAITICFIYLIIGVVDYIYEKYKFSEDMKMTKQEVKEEWKNTEGNPEVKNKQRRRMQEASRRRMMQAIPEADVVITNPTHFAVALKYEQDSGKAPIVVAKGEDYLAQKIKEVAREHEVEIVENKPLARMLYYNVDLGMEIPSELYQAVAEVLAFVWKLKNKI